ncbi:polysaccharide biosynthesis C-terminal domain-containing protein [Paenibacillus sp. LHD-38]|uniref:lipopolysaccharide biosynthesis protein n=1 Tax=Paenibacillus sp. LHD-38 TaxID=3072143 RepID=UPI00280CE66A|nr:polysaccharide biosynthesis C-terminal domain-containing protein [Paenibacillus sp. LHD-38]MDQ8738355.1 polysaccharide biosynthesis C-terminal domain-containing protein [Paenibacillus sp. LHD-38]
MRTKKAILNLAFSMALQFFTAISGFILPILFINTYGSTINGLVSSIKQIISYLNLVEAGVAAAASQALYSPLANKDTHRINGILSATRQFYIRSGGLFALMTIILACVYPFIIGDDVPNYLVAILVIVLGSSGVAEYYLIGKYRVLISADQKSYVLCIVQIIGLILNTITSIILMLMGFSVVTVLIASSLIYILRVFLLIAYVTRKYPKINFNTKPDILAIDKRWDAFIHQIVNMIVFNSPIIILTVFSTLADVSVYSIYLMVFSIITAFVTAFSNGLIAGFGEVLATKETKTVSNGYRLFEYIYYSVTVWIYMVAFGMILPFIRLYTQGIMDADYVQPLLAYMFVLVFLINNLRVPALTIIYAAGHFKETKFSAIVEAAISIIISIVCVQMWGIVGVLIGSACAAIYRIIDIILYANKHILYRPPVKSLVYIMFNLVIGILGYLLFASLFSLNSNNWFEWIMDSFVLCIGCFILIFIGNFLLDRSSFKDILKRINSIFRKVD